MRKEVLHGCTRRITTGCGNLYITLNRNDDGTPYECFIRLGKAGGCASCQTEALGRLITISLRAGAKFEEVIHQLKGIGCHQPYGFGPNRIMSCADAAAICLRDLADMEVVYAEEEIERKEAGREECELASRSDKEE